MKGIAEDIGWTLIVMISVVFVVLIAIVAYAIVKFPFGYLSESPDAASIEFVTANIRPYITANALSHFLAGDRNFLEHANEIAFSSVENASSDRLITYLSAFFAPYLNDDSGQKINLITVRITKNGTELFRYDNREKKCGDNFEGFCVDPNIVTDILDVGGVTSYQTRNIGCGKGRKKIDSSLYTKDENKCNPQEFCCTEDVTNGRYGTDIIKCGVSAGTGKNGVCDFEQNEKCVAGRLKIEEQNNECSSTGLICCLPQTEENLVQSRLAANAVVPLLYKDNSLGFLEVTTG